MKPLDLHRLIRFDAQGVRTQGVLQGQGMRAVLFCLKAGQSVPPHTAPAEVLLQVLQGRGRFRVGEAEYPVTVGDTVLCAPREPHGMTAQEDMAVLAVIVPAPARETATVPETMTVNEFIARHPASVAVFNRLGIDTCCGGHMSLAEAAAQRGMAVESLLEALRQAMGGPENAPGT